MSFTKLYKSLNKEQQKLVFEYAKLVEEKTESKVNTEDEEKDDFLSFESFDLFNYQKESIKSMESFELEGKITIKSPDGNINKYTNCGIFANPVGSGKTICMLELIRRNKMKCKSNKKNLIHRDLHGYSFQNKKYHSIDSTLIILPHGAVLKQWVNTIQEYNSMNYLIIDGQKKDPNNQDTIFPNKIKNLEKYDIIIVSSTYYNKFNDNLNDNNKSISNFEFIWKRIIIDEIDTIRIPNMYSIRSHFFWYISATYENICNIRNNGFLRDHFRSMTSNNQIEKLEWRTINYRTEYETMLEKLAISSITYECLPPINMYGFQHIRHMLSQNVMELINANDFDGAVSLIGGSKGSKDNITDIISCRILMEIDHIKNNIQNVRRHFEITQGNYLYQNYTNSQKEYLIRDHNDRIKKFNDKISTKESQIKTMLSNLNNMDNDDCTICCESHNQPVILNCSHIFCFTCIIQWIEMRSRVGDIAQCPNCREKIDRTLIMKIEKENVENKVEESCNKLGKDDTILKIIEQNPKGKYLIFSSSNNSFDYLNSNKIKKIFKNMNLNARMLKGNSSTMNKIIHDFKTGDIDILMLNSQYNGAGIHLPMTSDVILYNKLNKSLEKQVIGRALRLGRKDNFPLRVHYLTYSHE